MNIRRIVLLVTGFCCLATAYAQKKPVRILAFYNTAEDAPHVAFAEKAVSFFQP